MFRLFECCALSFFERFVLSFSLKIERFVSDSAEIWICGLYVIHTKKQQPGKYWKKSFAEVNLCVPNLSENEANTIRLNELERKAGKLLDDVVSTYDSTTYRYSIESIGTEADTALKCHYVNVRILFEVINVKL